MPVAIEERERVDVTSDELSDLLRRGLVRPGPRYGLDFSSEHRALQAGKPVILRVRGVDAELVPEGGTAVLTLYATGSWTWGGDADAIAHVREPLDRAGVLS